MLELKNIVKTYHVGDIETKALDDISVAFRQKEFVAILGASGSGKTTCLNIIGGLDRYDSGQLSIKGKKTKDFKEKDWDAYRNNSIGFVFQSYNLIGHLSIIANVEMSMTLSGVSSKEKRRRAVEVLEQVGLKGHLHKKPNQLSGGQMQRVAIARALANNPEILLCDEPTGALDSVTSVQIMELIKEVARDRLVIMVTHNPELANQYADRIIKFEDGKIISDTHSHEERPKEDMFKLTKTNMKFMTALGISYNNIRTKKGRTFLTAFASSIGIIGIAVILSLSSGFQHQIDLFQSDAMAEFPILINESTTEIDKSVFENNQNDMKGKMYGYKDYADTDYIEVYDATKGVIIHKNVFSEKFINYLKRAKKDVCSSIGYVRINAMNTLRKTDEKVKPVILYAMSDQESMQNTTSMSSMGLASFPVMSDPNSPSYLEKNYEVVAGKYPSKETDVVMVVETTNKLDSITLKNLGFDISDTKKIPFKKVVGTEFKLVMNNDYYAKTQMGNYIPNVDYDSMYDKKDNITIKISGIVRPKKGVKMAFLSTGIVYSDELAKKILSIEKDSDIVKAQKESDKNVMTMDDMDEKEKETFLAYLGGVDEPYMVMVYPTGFKGKEELVQYLDDYNKGKKEEDQIVYTDLAKSISEMTGGIMDGITMVLIAFAAVSLIVSLIMICIITYTSVLERTREIGILKALGARKKDITRVFDAETCILGVFSGTLGVVIAWLCTFPINQVIYDKTELENVARLKIEHAVILVIISTILTMLGGHIPAILASRKDAVDALRSE